MVPPGLGAGFMDIILGIAVPYTLLFAFSLWLLLRNQPPAM